MAPFVDLEFICNISSLMAPVLVYFGNIRTLFSTSGVYLHVVILLKFQVVSATTVQLSGVPSRSQVAPFVDHEFICDISSLLAPVLVYFGNIRTLFSTSGIYLQVVSLLQFQVESATTGQPSGVPSRSQVANLLQF